MLSATLCARERPPCCIKPRVEPFGSLKGLFFTKVYQQAKSRAPAEAAGLATQPLKTLRGCQGSGQACVRQVCGATTPSMVVFFPRE